MGFSDYFAVWDKMTPERQNRILGSIASRKVKKGVIIQNGGEECSGLLLIKSGQLRAYMLSPEGREITLYRLFERDLCLFSASCIMKSIQFDVTIETEKDTEFWIIPAEVYKGVMEESAPVANYTNEIMAARFSEVMWLINRLCGRAWTNVLRAFCWKNRHWKVRNSLSSPMRTSPTIWEPIGRLSPGCFGISRVKGWSA